MKDLSLLIKLRLNLTVVFSAITGYLMATGLVFNGMQLLILAAGGFLVTSSANAINQILEKDFDKLMKRTKNRPLAANRMGVPEAILIAGIMGMSGLVLLWFFFGSLTALLGAFSLISYAFIYTPLKRMGQIAVFVGAIPGALPPMIGWVAATGSLGLEAYILFSIQFLWQFPHFWSIGWLAYDDYKEAGFKLMPTKVDGRNRQTVLNIIIYIIALLAVGTLPFYVGLSGYLSLMVVLGLGLMFLISALILMKNLDRKSALRVMFASLIYLPIAQIILVVDKI